MAVGAAESESVTAVDHRGIGEHVASSSPKGWGEYDRSMSLAEYAGGGDALLAYWILSGVAWA